MYAALVVSAQLAAGDHIHELAIASYARAALALGLAFAAARPDGRFDLWIALFVGWLAAIGAIVIAGQLWQRYVDDGTGNFVLIDPAFFAVTLASEFLLVVAGLSLFAVRRTA